MKAGRLRERILIQKEVKQTTSANQKIGDWVDVCEVWAEAKCTSSSAVNGDGFVVHTSVWKFFIRRRDDITAQMRVKWKDRIFVLEGAPVDWSGERNGMTLVTKELI